MDIAFYCDMKNTFITLRNMLFADQMKESLSNIYVIVNDNSLDCFFLNLA